MKITAEPRSDQWNADDFVGGKAKTFTISGVRAGKAEQKYDIELAEGQGRVWRPPLTVIRILIDAWGDESDEWIGRRVALYREPSVTFGREKTGGIRVSHMSHLPGGKPFTYRATVSRGRRQDVVIKPLPESTESESPQYQPILQSVADRIRAGNLTDEDRQKAADYLAKLTNANPAEVAELRALIDQESTDGQ